MFPSHDQFRGVGTYIRDVIRHNESRTITDFDNWNPKQVSNLITWLDPSDRQTLFQERTGASATTICSLGDPVGTILDKSGNGNHATAPSDGARPTLTKDSTGNIYLDFNKAGTPDEMEMPHGAVPDPDTNYTISIAASNLESAANAGFWSNGRFNNNGQSNTLRTGGGVGDPHYLHFFWNTSLGLGTSFGVVDEPINGKSYVITVRGEPLGERTIQLNRRLERTGGSGAVSNAGTELSLLGRGVSGESLEGGIWQFVAYSKTLSDAEFNNLERFMKRKSR